MVVNYSMCLGMKARESEGGSFHKKKRIRGTVGSCLHEIGKGKGNPTVVCHGFTSDETSCRRGGMEPAGCAACLRQPPPARPLRRNFAEISEIFSFPLVTGIRNFGIFRYISCSNLKFNKFRPKFNEIHRNLPKFRNGISFPLNTGI